MNRSSRHCFLVALALLALVVAASASGQSANEDLALVVAQNGAAVAASHGLDLVQEYGAADNSLLLVRLAPGQSPGSLRTQLASDPNILAVDEVSSSALGPPSRSQAQVLAELESAGEAAGLVSSPCLDSYFSDGSWAGWAEQTVASVTMVREAQAAAGHCGEGVTVALIDTGVDADHPLLTDAVVPGYDFISNFVSRSSEWTGLGGTNIAIIENSLRATAVGTNIAIIESSPRQIALSSSAGVSGTLMCIIESGSFGVLLAENETESFEELELPPRFGHGTMVAGLIRLVAPGAKIMPLRAFDAYGAGNSVDIVRAIYYATDHGADVINMSFSMEKQSPAVNEALRYARDHGVVVVAAAGNRSTNESTYPASDHGVVGVASSDLADQLADFSNYGPNTADLVAPGVALISSYPGGHYATGWGTSFSTPLVAGAAALLRVGQPDNSQSQRDTVEDILAGVEFVDLQGKVFTGGRLDVLGAVEESID